MELEGGMVDSKVYYVQDLYHEWEEKAEMQSNKVKVC